MMSIGVIESRQAYTVLDGAQWVMGGDGRENLWKRGHDPDYEPPKKESNYDQLLEAMG